MKNRFFLTHGLLIWVPSKIAVTALILAPLFGGFGETVHFADVDSYIDPPLVRSLVFVYADQELPEPKSSEVPDPESPTTDGPWSEMISANPKEAL